MKAAVLHQPGNAENILLEERPIPDPTEEQVLVRVRAFGLNRSELMTRKGLSPDIEFPRVLGIECVGEVVDDPSGEYTHGQSIMALMGGMGRDFDGSYAEYTVLPKRILHPFRSDLPWEILGAIPEMYQTVYGSLHLALNIQRGETLLIRGGTSSVGMLATQVARCFDLTVIATTRSEAKRKRLLQNGASHALIDDGSLSDQVSAIVPAGVDKVLDLVGAPTLKDSLACVKPSATTSGAATSGGVVCMTGMLSESWAVPNFAPMEFIPATVRLTVYDSGQISSPTHVFQEFINEVEAGRIRLPIGSIFRLDEIVAAHRTMESNKANGKIVVVL